MTTIRCAQFGSISSGTNRAEDLIPAFGWELAGLLEKQSQRFPRKEYRSLIREAARWNANAGNVSDADYTDDLLRALSDALDYFSPPYGYFGAHSYDGADYGFWLIEDVERQVELRVSDLSEMPAGYSGELLCINDHGSVTLYNAYKGKLKMVWALV